MSWATDRLDAIKAGTVTLPPVVQTLRLGLLDDWGPGWAKKRWTPDPALLNGDGSQFGGMIAALADQILTFAAMSVVPDGRAFRTSGLDLRFFALLGLEPVDAEARVVAQSRKVIHVEADLRKSEGSLAAKAFAQQIVIDLPDP